MSNDENHATQSAGSQPKKQQNTRLIIIFVALLLLVQGVNFYFHYKAREEKEATQQELMATYGELESLGKELDEKIKKIEELGGDVKELEAAKIRLESEKKELRQANSYTREQLDIYKSKAEGYAELLKAKDKEIAKLKEINQELLEENTDLKTEKQKLSASIKELNASKDQLASKVQVASQLKAENIKVIAVNKRGREREEDFKARHIDQLKIEFNIAENEVAPIEGKEILIRIIDPQGNVLFDVNTGSGTFFLRGKETFYTAKQDILFDNTGQALTFMYDKGSEYEEGVYQLEVYTDDYKMGEKAFSVR